jgi:membrane associated rhomboid family serine protease
VFPLRDDTPCERTPVVTWALIAVNLAVFGWQVTSGLERSVLVGGAIPYELLTFQDPWPRALVPPPLTVVTSMFMHGGLVHLGGNMLFLWIFGNNVEDALGRPRFLAFYLVSGAAAAAAQTVATAVQASQLTSAEASAALSIPMVGASGAIGGVLAAYMVLFPRALVQTLFIIVFIVRIVYLPAVVFIGGWFLLQLASVIFGGTPGVAFFAHIGGFLAGLAMVKLLGRRPGWHRAAPRWAGERG